MNFGLINSILTQSMGIPGGTVPYFRPYFVGIFPEIRPYIGLIYGRYLQ